MKKKQYITPELEIVKINVCQLMAGSLMGDVVTEGSLDSGIDGLAREFEIEPDMTWEDDFDYDFEE